MGHVARGGGRGGPSACRLRTLPRKWGRVNRGPPPLAARVNRVPPPLAGVVGWGRSGTPTLQPSIKEARHGFFGPSAADGIADQGCDRQSSDIYGAPQGLPCLV